MSIILQNSRDIGNKFLFGNFIMGSKFAVPPTKHDPDITKAWVFLTKEDRANDYDLGGEVFSYPGKGNVEDRTWRVLDGSDSDLKVEESSIKMWVAKEMMKGANGIAVWLDKDGWTYKKSFLEKLSSICKTFKVKIIGFTPPYPKADGYSDTNECTTAFKDIFEMLIIYNFVDNWISFDDAIKDMTRNGYTKTMGSMQDTYRNGVYEGVKCYGAWIEKHDNYAVWKNLAGYSVAKSKPFCLYNPQKTYTDNRNKLTKLKNIMNGSFTVPQAENNNWQSYDNIVGPGEGEEGTDADPD